MLSGEIDYQECNKWSITPQGLGGQKKFQIGA